MNTNKPLKEAIMIVVRDAILTLLARDSDQYRANRQRKSNTLLRSSRPQDGSLISYKIIWHICFYFKAFGNKVRIAIGGFASCAIFFVWKDSNLILLGVKNI
jgi:hypothetical protein